MIIILGRIAVITNAFIIAFTSEFIPKELIKHVFAKPRNIDFILRILHI